MSSFNVASNEEGPKEYKNIGVAGCILTSLLLITVLWRFSIFWQHADRNEQYKKKFCFYILICLSVISDFPMYVGFIEAQDYVISLYSVHKLTVAFLFSAYSITISDWIHVLHDLREETCWKSEMRKNTLIAVNVVIWIISITNFSNCFSTGGMQAYVNSPFYIIGIFIQIASTLIINLMMLYSGLKLYNRISGATGYQGSLTPILKRPLIQKSTTPDVKVARDSRGSFNSEFRGALRILIRVMIICFTSILSQIILLFLNYILGFAVQANRTVGPVYFYWIFYAWIPLWGPVLSLLYLARTSMKKKIQSPYTKPSFQSDLRGVESETNDDSDEAGTNESSSRTSRGSSTTLYINGDERNNSRSDSKDERQATPLGADGRSRSFDDPSTDIYAIDYRASNVTQTSGISQMSQTAYSDMGYREFIMGRGNTIVADYEHT